MPNLRRGFVWALPLCAATLLGHPALGQGPVQPPQSTYLQTWPLAITPNDITSDPITGILAIVDAGNSTIQLLRPGGTHLGQIRGFRDPRAAAFTPSGTLLVGEAGTGSVKGYSIAGAVTLTLGSPSGEFITPNDIAVHPSGAMAYVADSAVDVVKAYSLADGVHQFDLGSFGTGDGELRFPISVTVRAATGEVFVGDSRNRRIVVFNAADGSFIRNIGVAGGGGGEISFVGGLHADPNQRLFVVESLGGFVQIFDPFGGFVSQIGEHGKGPGLLRSPKAVTIDGFNRLLVTSYLDKKIEVWGLDQYENPVDQDLIAKLIAIPSRLNVRHPSFTVIIDVPGIDPSLLDPDSIRLNGTVAPLPGSSSVGPHLTVRFSRTGVIATLPTGASGNLSLPLKGKTFGGLRFEGDLHMVIAVPQRTRRPTFRWRP